MNISNFPSKNTAQPLRPQRLPILARLSGRDAATLAACAGDELGTTRMLGLSMLTSTAIHATSMTAALAVLGVPLPIAGGIAAVTASGLFAVDRINLHASDLAKGETALRRIDGAVTKAIGSWGARLAGQIGRVVFSVCTAATLALFVGLHFYDDDFRAVLAEEQAAIDAPLRAAADLRLDIERGALVRAIEVASGIVDRQAGAQADRLSKAQALRDRLASEEAQLAELRDRLAAEAAAQRDLARCELVDRGAPDCEAASGKPGDGPLRALAVARAAEAEAQATAATARLEAVAQQRAAAERALDTIRSGEAEGADMQRLSDARAALADFESARPKRLAEMVAAAPGHRRIDPDSLAERLWALAVLAEKPAAMLAMAATMVASFGLELLGFIAAVLAPRSEYVLRRAAGLDALARSLRNAAAGATVDDEDYIIAADRIQRARADRAFADAFAGRTHPFFRWGK
jgi:hypothetical protein